MYANAQMNHALAVTTRFDAAWRLWFKRIPIICVKSYSKTIMPNRTAKFAFFPIVHSIARYYCRSRQLRQQCIATAVYHQIFFEKRHHRYFYFLCSILIASCIRILPATKITNYIDKYQDITQIPYY